MSKTWVIVADRARARILEPRDEQRKPLSEIVDFVGRAGYAGPEKFPPRKMDEIDDFIFPEGRMKKRELKPDRDGTFAETGVPRQTGDDPTDIEHQTARQFAMKLVARLDQARLEGRFDKLVLVAAPLFLGVLREKLTPPLKKMVCHELNKDYSKLRPEEIRQHLPDEL